MEPLCVIPRIEDGYPTIFVVLKNCRTTEYVLHRYFLIGGNWGVSVDLDDVSLEHCLRLIDDGMKELYESVLQTAGEV